MFFVRGSAGLFFERHVAERYRMFWVCHVLGRSLRGWIRILLIATNLPRAWHVQRRVRPRHVLVSDCEWRSM